MLDDPKPGQGELPAGQTTGEGDKGTPETITFTKEERDKWLNDQKAAWGRDNVAPLRRDKEKAEADRAALQAQNKELADRLAQIEHSIDEAEFAKVKDKPDLAKLYEERRDVREQQRRNKEERAQIEAERQSLLKDKEDVSNWRRQSAAAEIARKYGVDPTILASVTDGKPESMEKLAQVLPKVTAPQPANTGNQPPANLVGRGAQGQPTNEQLEKMTMAEYEQYWKRRAGLIK